MPIIEPVIISEVGILASLRYVVTPHPVCVCVCLCMCVYMCTCLPMCGMSVGRCVSQRYLYNWGSGWILMRTLESPIPPGPCRVREVVSFLQQEKKSLKACIENIYENNKQFPHSNLIPQGPAKPIFSVKLSQSPNLEMAPSLAVCTSYFALLLCIICACFILSSAT